jgi:hypothetical protein
MNSQPSSAIENGLTSQLTPTVATIPRQWFRTCPSAARSISPNYAPKYVFLPPLSQIFLRTRAAFGGVGKLRPSSPSGSLLGRLKAAPGNVIKRLATAISPRHAASIVRRPFAHSVQCRRSSSSAPDVASYFAASTMRRVFAQVREQRRPVAIIVAACIAWPVDRRLDFRARRRPANSAERKLPQRSIQRRTTAPRQKNRKPGPS